MNNSNVFRTWFMLKLTYTIVPIVVGIDKCYTGLIVDWSQYVSPLAINSIPLTMTQFLVTLGIIEIVAGIVVWFRPRLGAYAVAGLLVLIIANLASMNMYYDIIARDAVIAVGAIALAWLSDEV